MDGGKEGRRDGSMEKGRKKRRAMKGKVKKVTKREERGRARMEGGGKKE